MKALVLFIGITILLDSLLYPILSHFKDRYDNSVWKNMLAVLWMIARGLNLVNITIVFAWLLKDYMKV